MANYYAPGDPVTLTGVEADFLSGPWSGKSAWKPDHDDGFDHESPARKFAERGSPNVSPAGPACCSS
jgi:hypothetical protein